MGYWSERRNYYFSFIQFFIVWLVPLLVFVFVLDYLFGEEYVYYAFIWIIPSIMVWDYLDWKNRKEAK